jgi:hypothetical protein
MAFDDGTFPALLKTLSDASEDVRISLVMIKLIKPTLGCKTRLTSIGNIICVIGRILYKVHGQSFVTI